MILFYIFSAIVRSEFQKDRSYSVSVKSKYSDVQTLDHFLYFLSDFSLDTSNRFLSEVLQHSDRSQTINDIEFLSSIISNLNLLSPSSLSILKSYIDINYYLPRCEMLRSLAHDIANDPVTLINDDPGFFLASKNPIENIDNFQYFQTNFTQSFNYDLNLNEYNSKRETLFIYADLTKEKASNFVLQIINGQHSTFNNYNIILRPLSYSNKTANLRGYGVEMRPYKYLMEYEIDDDTHNSNDKDSDTAAFKEDVTTKNIDFETTSDYLNYTEIPFFGSKFTNYLSSENTEKELPLLLRDMSNNWPVYIRKISEEDVSVESTKQYEKISLFAERSQSQQNQNKDDDGGSPIYTVSTLNGRVFNIKNFDAFTFIEQIQKEQSFVDFLYTEFNLTKSDIQFNEPFKLNDDYLLDYRTKYAVWNKDYEKDNAYKDWSTNIKNIFRLRKNILNFLVYLDPTNPVHLTELYTVYLISQPQKTKDGKKNPLLPMRIGVVPRFNMASKASRRVAFAFAHLALHNQRDALKFLINSFAVWKKSEDSSKNKKDTGIKEEHYILAYDRIKASYKIDWGDLHKLFSPDSREYNFILESNIYFRSCGAKTGSIRVNGKEISLDKSLQDLVTQIQQMVLSISKICQFEHIYDLENVDVVDLLKKEYLVVQSVDDAVLKQQVSGLEIYNSNTKKQKSFVEAFRKVEWTMKDNQNPRSYFVLFTPKVEKSIQKVNEENVDVENDAEVENREIQVESEVEKLFIEFAKNKKHKRSTAFAVNPAQLGEFIGIEENETALLVNGRIYRSFNLETVDQLKLIDYWSDQFVLSYVDSLEASAKSSKTSNKNEEKQKTDEDEIENNEDESYLDEGEKDDTDETNLSNNKEEEEESKKALSFDALSYITAVAVDWRKFGLQRVNVQKIFDGVSGLTDCPLYYTNRKSSADSKSNKIEWILIVDPVTRNFQKIADFIYYTCTVKNIVDLQLVAIPPQTINANNNEQQENDLNCFYRYSLTNDDVTFSMLNDTLSYSTFIDTPQSWLLESLKTSDNLDVDSVQLTKSNTNKEAVFLLSSMVVEGKVNIDGAPIPKYADVGLFTKKSMLNHFRSQKVDETTVLPMNSYFQFKADPGVYRVVFSSNTSSNLYTFDHKDQEFPLFDNIYVETFSKKDFYLNGKIRAKNAEAYKHSLQERSNRLRQESLTSNKTKSHINIFTIASGKLYERLCKIMFLSTREHTDSTITFYLIKSFLSPSFKASLPEMAKKYSFNYNLVDYKWPSWLNKQKEKQRNIWANKILFLDVLFPSNVDKIIYVDADQIVRADLQELMDLDIAKEGAPYAFVPFCDSRPEIEPYRFWKQGYWKEILTKDKDKNNKGQKSPQNINQPTSRYNYHISALFAIDLVKFKDILAGDQLRVSYQQLSIDPKNLANLDQDLPNSLQKHIPIYSLSQDWLWCETWCADEEMESAKTIDLCNNPLTKINKIEIAKERVQEWPKLDEEAKKTEDGIASDDYEHFVFHN